MTTAQVHTHYHATSGTWSYLVADAARGVAAIIDPVLDYDAASGRTATTSAQALLELAIERRYAVQWILETHAHADHLSGAQWLKARLPQARVAIGVGIREVQRTFAPVFGLGPEFARDGSQFDHLFADGERFVLGAIEAEVIATPGHTSDSVAYRIGDALFTGDSLFLPDAGTARCDFPGGSAATLYRSIQRLYALPDATRVFVCHDYGPGGREPRCETTLGEQKRANIHVRPEVSEADYVHLREARDATLAMPQLILPAIQVNLRAGHLPDPDADGARYLRIPLDRI